MTDVPEPASDEAARALAESLRAGIAQRTAELASLEHRGGPAVLDLEESEFVEEPVPVSARPGLARLIVFSRKVVYHLFLKWMVQDLLQQQNAFNQAASRWIRELLEENQRLRARLEALERPPTRIED